MPKVLLVEDNEMNLDMLSRRLRRRGYEVLAAKDGAEGVEKARSALPDLVIMDMSLPVMDGYEATRILKASAATREIPILGLSAHAMAGDARKALDAGCDDYDTKPVELKRLLGKMDDLLAAESPGAAPPQKPEPAPPRVEAQAPPHSTAPSKREKAATASRKGPEGPQLLKAPRGRILVAGGSMQQFEVVSQLLGQLGYSSRHTNDAPEILDSAERQEIDALLLDHRSSNLRAEQLIPQLRSRSQTRGLPIVVLTSTDELSNAFRCIRLGAEAYLPFPFSLDLLAMRLRFILEKRSVPTQHGS